MTELKQLYNLIFQKEAETHDNETIMSICDSILYRYQKGKIDFATAKEIITEAMPD